MTGRLGLSPEERRALTSTTDVQLALVLHTAQAEPGGVGLLLRAAPIEKARAAFYAEKRRDPALADLQLRSLWVDGELCLAIVRGEALATAQAAAQSGCPPEAANGIGL